MTTRTPRSPTASCTAAKIISRGTGLMAGPPTARPNPGLVTTPTPTPPSSAYAGAQLTVAVRCAPWVTSGSSPASLTTTASARSASMSHRSTGNETRCPAGSPTSTLTCGCWVASAVTAALAAAALQVPVVQPERSALVRTRAVLGRDGSRSSGGSLTGAPGPGPGREPSVRLGLRHSRPCGARGNALGGRGVNASRQPPEPGRRAPSCACRACAP